ncbi:putative membrane protein [Mycobacterium basiliense]|uniref:Putative membrane protein n=1 Tax=Mycobacterium basiliense TaxID=2094119 RepID=A0A447GDE8_9MYCO|nr:FUSC family protein [Mycobacterium basiliense]VDM88419.1 putative membrane protein [Mycobacterium basiliense]
MTTSLLTRVADGGLAAVHRLRAVVWPITQTSVAAGLAWYLAHDVLDHPQPFFAPISAVVCMSATNVLRARRAAQMIVGVALGIVVGAAVHVVLGTGPLAMAVAVFVALCVAVLGALGFIGQGLMFVNQTAVSSVLVLVFASTGGVVGERLFDALIGGGLAFVFAILLFPADPARILADARVSVLAALHDTLVEVTNIVDDPARVAPDWPLAAFDRLHAELGGLLEARATAVVVVRIAPRRWASRNSILDVEQQSARLGMLVSGVLELARDVTRTFDRAVQRPVRIALDELAKAMSVAHRDPATATACAAAARAQALEVGTSARDRAEVVLADILCACADDLQQVIDLPGLGG